jgi:uncharacterized surface protein with fasciclin (FAS1) repeats
MSRTSSIVPLLAGIALLAACSDAPTQPEPIAVPDQVAESRAPAPGGATVAEIADAAGFDLLLAAVGYIAEVNPGSPLVAGLLDDEQYTVFAPTNRAFLDLVDALDLPLSNPFGAIDAALGAGTVEAVVSYHVVEGRRAANSVVPPAASPRPRTMRTLLPGASFRVDSSGRITAVGNSASIVAPDISASNGIIHVIDAVILPIEL